jgi:hypothetical protein
VAVALAPARQALPHMPQCAVAVPSATSQPLAGSLSQSPKPVSQRPTVQRLLTHAGAPLALIHAAPQAPQWAAELAVLTHAPSQQVSAPGHARSGEQPSTQALATQRWPAAHCVSAVQATQALRAVSQRGVAGVAAQPSSR